VDLVSGFSAVDYRLTTAEIVYRLPDNPEVLQSFVWQALDIAPDYPRLSRFIKFWRDNIDAELHSVRIGQVPAQRRPVMHHLAASDARH
jgi:uncharacterized protein Usg